MPELDTIVLFNPTSEDFTWKYNGEPYTVKTGEAKSFAKFVGYHLAKHLSTQMLESEIRRTKKEKSIDMAKQYVIYDSPERRISLYRIFKDVLLVQECIAAYPFKGFVGEMKVYEDFVKKEEAKELDKGKADASPQKSGEHEEASGTNESSPAASSK